MASYIRYPTTVSALPVPISDGGTGSATALSNNRIVVSSAGALIEAGAITASRALISDSNGLPTHATVTSTEMGYISGVTSAVQTQMNAKQADSGLTAAQIGSMPYWTKYTTAHTLLQTAATSNNITLFTLPAKAVIHKVILKHSIAFTGGLIASYTISIGIAGTLAKYIAAFDVFQTVASTAFSVPSATILETPEDFSSGVAIKISAIAVGANLNATTQGSVDTYVLASNLP